MYVELYFLQYFLPQTSVKTALGRTVFDKFDFILWPGENSFSTPVRIALSDNMYRN